MHRSALWLALFLLLAGLFLIRESDQPWMVDLDNRFHDLLMQQDSQPARRPAVVLVEINARSLRRADAWPWAPLDYAMFLKAILPGRPGVVAIEPILHWPGAPSYKNILESYLLKTPKLLLSAELVTIREDTEETPVALPIFKRVQGNLAGLPEYATVRQVPLPDFADRATLGAIDLAPDSDQRLRKAPMVMRYRGDAIPSFILQSIMLWLKLVPEDVVLHIGKSIRLGDVLEIPIDAAGNMRLNFQSGNAVQRIGFDELLLASEEREAGITPSFDVEAAANKIVLLGRTDAESRVYPLANHRLSSRAEILAAAIATIQQRGFIYPLGFQGKWIIVLSVVLLSLLSWKLPRRFLFWSALILAAVYAMIAGQLLTSKQLLLPAILPYALLLMLLVLRMFIPTPARQS